MGRNLEFPWRSGIRLKGFARAPIANVFYRDGSRVILLLAAHEDPQLDEHEMGLAEDSLWVVKHFDPHVP